MDKKNFTYEIFLDNKGVPLPLVPIESDKKLKIVLCDDQGRILLDPCNGVIAVVPKSGSIIKYTNNGERKKG